MATLLLTLLFLLVIVALMAIGLMFGRPPIKGSCGGMSALAGQADCPICGGDPVRCDEASARPSPAPGAGVVRNFDPRADRDTH